MTDFDQQTQAIFNDIARSLGLQPRSQMPRWRYYQSKSNRFLFGWTTEKTSNKAKPYSAFIYKRTKNGMRLVKEIRFKRRQSAKARAIKWCNTYDKRYNTHKQKQLEVAQ